MSLLHLLRMGAGHQAQALQGPPIQEGARVVEELHQDGGHPGFLAGQVRQAGEIPRLEQRDDLLPQLASAWSQNRVISSGRVGSGATRQWTRRLP